jgi:hypothetical protein
MGSVIVVIYYILSAASFALAISLCRRLWLSHYAGRVSSGLAGYLSATAFLLPLVMWRLSNGPSLGGGALEWIYWTSFVWVVFGGLIVGPTGALICLGVARLRFLCRDKIELLGCAEHFDRALVRTSQASLPGANVCRDTLILGGLSGVSFVWAALQCHSGIMAVFEVFGALPYLMCFEHRGTPDPVWAGAQYISVVIAFVSVVMILRVMNQTRPQPSYVGALTADDA